MKEINVPLTVWFDQEKTIWSITIKIKEWQEKEFDRIMKEEGIWLCPWYIVKQLDGLVTKEVELLEISIARLK